MDIASEAPEEKSRGGVRGFPGCEYDGRGSNIDPKKEGRWLGY
jgi:hypothetical protein